MISQMTVGRVGGGALPCAVSAEDLERLSAEARRHPMSCRAAAALRAAHGEKAAPQTPRVILGGSAPKTPKEGPGRPL